MTRTGLGRGNARPASYWAAIFGWASVTVGRSLPGVANEQQPEPSIARMSRSRRVWRRRTPFFFFFFSSFFQSICPRMPRSDLAEQSAKNNLPTSPCQFANQNQLI
jgi:hypothetical protein